MSIETNSKHKGKRPEKNGITISRQKKRQEEDRELKDLELRIRVLDESTLASFDDFPLSQPTRKGAKFRPTTVDHTHILMLSLRLCFVQDYPRRTLLIRQRSSENLSRFRSRAKTCLARQKQAAERRLPLLSPFWNGYIAANGLRTMASGH